MVVAQGQCRQSTGLKLWHSARSFSCSELGQAASPLWNEASLFVKWNDDMCPRHITSLLGELNENSEMSRMPCPVLTPGITWVTLDLFSSLLSARFPDLKNGGSKIVYLFVSCSWGSYEITCAKYLAEHLICCHSPTDEASIILFVEAFRVYWESSLTELQPFKFLCYVHRIHQNGFYGSHCVFAVKSHVFRQVIFIH